MPAEAITAEKLVLRAERSEGIIELARPRESVEEAELEEVADAEVGEGAEVARQFVVFRLARVLGRTGKGLLRLAPCIAATRHLLNMRTISMPSSLSNIHHS